MQLFVESTSMVSLFSINLSSLTMVLLSVNSGLHLLSFLYNDDICLQGILGSNATYFLIEYKLFAEIFYLKKLWFLNGSLILLFRYM